MPIDFSSRQSDSKNGLLSVLKLSIPYTGEVLNLGVILQDAITHEIRTKTVEDFGKLGKCFQIPDIENVQYAIEMFQKRQISRDTICAGELSPSLIVSEPSKYIITSQNIEEELLNAFSSKVSLAKQLEHKRKINPFSKTKLITTIQQEIKAKKWDKTIKTRKHIPMEFGEEKEISFVSFAGKKPIVATQLVSLYVDFWDTFQNAMLLKYLKDETITDKVIYMPPAAGKTGFADKIRFVREEAEKEDFTLIDAADHNEVLELMKEKADQALLIA
ncbi:MAG: hypothetical protein JU82_06030 [Sulfuricurvum sp. MLSB]|uniref:hypothetical protein n=1 Tax=unclassified Sulfuricurvum TaxID=2632390 RepID=UPI0005068391|nr:MULTISPECIES: hypothetical protein [unclassified Sulfuricurvum]KFN39740.1 MAG: hypothetical protein JU82_06030 [Sulfuricurvum sp. MLSB]